MAARKELIHWMTSHQIHYFIEDMTLTQWLEGLAEWGDPLGEAVQIKLRQAGAELDEQWAAGLIYPGHPLEMVRILISSVLLHCM